MGIESVEPGFKSVLIKPSLGDLKNASCVFAHPNGNIKINIDKNTAEIELPKNIKAIFIWNNKNLKLKTGKNIINLFKM